MLKFGWCVDGTLMWIESADEERGIVKAARGEGEATRAQKRFSEAIEGIINSA
jgi:hypothetical protein